MATPLRVQAGQVSLPGELTSLRGQRPSPRKAEHPWAGGLASWAPQGSGNCPPQPQGSQRHGRGWVLGKGGKGPGRWAPAGAPASAARASSPRPPLFSCREEGLCNSSSSFAAGDGEGANPRKETETAHGAAAAEESPKSTRHVPPSVRGIIRVPTGPLGGAQGFLARLVVYF